MNAPEQLAALDAIYRAEHHRLLRYLGKRAGPDDAPDIAQEAFLRFHSSGMLALAANRRAYLTRIARNLAIDAARRDMRRFVVARDYDEMRDTSAPPRQAWRIEAIDVLRFYRQTVRAMPPKTRRVFVMHRMRKRTYKEIAAELGVCVQTVEYHMSRALAHCRAAVAAQW